MDLNILFDVKAQALQDTLQSKVKEEMDTNLR